MDGDIRPVIPMVLFPLSPPEHPQCAWSRVVRLGVGTGIRPTIARLWGCHMPFRAFLDGVHLAGARAFGRPPLCARGWDPASPARFIEWFLCRCIGWPKWPAVRHGGEGEGAPDICKFMRLPLRARLKIARYGQEATVPSPFCTEIKQARCLNLAFSALSSLFSLASGNFQTGSKSR